ncbi:MAG: RagB/SusD family nutrient uptake outer membrane protein [Bacteroidales bacterium]|nr:RagB/SusD family nutrient uptake outer membrane protein [Bacteroidales bacterium]
MKLYNILATVAIAFSLTACELDYVPHSSITEEQSILSPVDIKRMSNGIYDNLRACSYGVHDIFADLCTEDFAATLTSGNHYFGASNWTIRTSSDPEITEIWDNYYALIAKTNYLINEHTRTTYTTDADTLILFEALGTAHLSRAWAYTKLVNYFALPYYSDKDGGTVNADALGLPIELTINLKTRLPRATVGQVYAQINADIDSAYKYFAELREAGVKTPQYKASSSRFNLDAVNMLRARVKLYQGQWAEALKAAEEVLNTGAYPLSTTQEELEALWATDEGTEIITHLFISADEKPLSNSTYRRLLGWSGKIPIYQADFLPTIAALDLYEATDYRYDAYYSTDYLEMGDDYYTFEVFNKYPLTTEFVASGNIAHSPILFRSAEAHLIAAEAAARLGDDAKSQAQINALRVSRGLAATTATGTALLDIIKLERRKEFMGEGFNLIDKKRWHEGVDRTNVGGQVKPEMTPSMPSALQQKYEAGHPRFVWPIPGSEVQNNTQAVQNPNY